VRQSCRRLGAAVVDVAQLGDIDVSRKVYDGGSSVKIAFVDNNDGTYVGSYQLSVGADWAIHVLLEGEVIVDGDVRVLEVGTGAVSVPMSQALGPALSNAVAGRTQSIIVLVNDVSGLPYVRRVRLSHR
jgi:hypothetical protein